MKEKVVDYLFNKIKINDNKYNEIKLEEIKYGLYGLYTLITKTSIIILLALLFDMFNYFIIFFLFYCVIRSVGYGVHAKSNIQCWFFSTVLILGIPFLFMQFNINTLTKTIIWSLCFVNYLLFCPADTDKRPMINKLRKLKFKVGILFISVIYLIIIFKFENISNLILGAMVLEALLTNPLGYLLMGQKIRFRLNDLYIFKQN